MCKKKRKQAKNKKWNHFKYNAASSSQKVRVQSEALRWLRKCERWKWGWLFRKLQSIFAQRNWSPLPLEDTQCRAPSRFYRVQLCLQLALCDHSDTRWRRAAATSNTPGTCTAEYWSPVRGRTLTMFHQVPKDHLWLFFSVFFFLSLMHKNTRVRFTCHVECRVFSLHLPAPAGLLLGAFILLRSLLDPCLSDGQFRT